MRAVFTGQDGSLGYQTGITYELEFVDPRGHGQLAIQRKGMGLFESKGFCPYTSEATFLQNWQVLPELAAPQPNQGGGNA